MQINNLFKRVQDITSSFSQNMHNSVFIKLAAKNNIKTISTTYNKSQQPCVRSHNTSQTISQISNRNKQQVPTIT